MFAIFGVLLLAGAEVSVRADDVPRLPISRDAILATLHSSGMPIRADQMEQLSGVTAAESNPLMKVLTVDMLDGESDKVLMRCEHPNTCLPFYVLVHWGPPGGDSGARAGQRDATPAGAALRREDMWVRSGRFVILMLDGEYIHMTMPVLCLQNGGRGQKVRVINKETKKRYVARVAGPGLVTSVLAE